MFCQVVLWVAHARVNNQGTLEAQGQEDVMCWGGTPAGTTNEVCIDALGNVVPTTNVTQTLGASTLQWLTGFLQSAALGKGTLTVPAGSTLLVSGHLVSTQVKSPAAQGTACGSSPSAAITGSDNAFTVQVGGSPAASCQVNFAVAYNNTPICQAQSVALSGNTVVEVTPNIVVSNTGVEFLTTVVTNAVLSVNCVGTTGG